MRPFGLVGVVAVVCAVASCGRPAPPPASSSAEPARAQAQIDPARIARARGALPPGYEVGDVSGPASPAAFWGFGPGWVADPQACGALAGPASDSTTTRGWSGSGPGGIVHAVVTGSPTAPVTFDPAMWTDCGRWSVTSGNTTGTVDLVDAPAIDGAETVGMATVARTVVEGGTETTSTASTFSAYLGDYLAFVTVVTDPGSPGPALDRDFAAALLVKTVSALRG